MVAGVNQEIETVLKSLKTNRFTPVEFVATAEAAAKLVLDMVPLNAKVGVAGSVTVRQIGLVKQLRARGNKIIDITSPSKFPPAELARRTLRSDILLSSSNAITLDGKLVNIDGIGNRVASMIFGPKKVILIISMNKLTRDVTEAIDRIKYIIAPYHAMIKGQKTPCAIDGLCTDCKSPERICNVTTIIEKRPSETDMAIVLVGEDLGLGWDHSWPSERKEKIASAYREARKSFSQATQRGSLEK